MAYQASVLFFFLLIIGAPCILAYVSYRREMKGHPASAENATGGVQVSPEVHRTGTPQESQEIATPLGSVILHPNRSRQRLAAPEQSPEQRAAAVASIVREARSRFGRQE